MDTINKSQVQGNAHAAEKDAEYKAKKAAAAKAFSERQKEKKEMTKKVCQYLVDSKTIDKLPEDLKKFVNETLNPTVARPASGSSFFNKVFGDSPKVGDSITLIDYMKKTLQAKGKLDKAVKEWAEKGIVVEYTAKPNQLESTYTIKKLA